MPAILKGKAKYKIPENAKPGDEVEISGHDFEADQEDFERALAGRLAQQKRQFDAKEQELTKKLAELEEKGGNLEGEKKLKAQLDALQAKLADSELKSRIDSQLKAAGLSDLPDEFRPGRLKADASDEDVAEAVKAAGDRFAKLKESLGVKQSTEEDTPKSKTLGQRGAGGSGDKKAKVEAMRDKVKRVKPSLLPMLEGMSDEQQQDIMASWDDQGLLNSPQK